MHHFRPATADTLGFGAIKAHTGPSLAVDFPSVLSGGYGFIGMVHVAGKDRTSM